MNANYSYCRTMAIKGVKADINAALKESGWSVHIHEEKIISDNIVTLKIELEDPYVEEFDMLPLLKYKNIKYAILVHPEESYTDVIAFKDYGSNEHEIFNAYANEYVSIYSEELEGEIFFPDEPFEYSYEDYDSGEECSLEYAFTIKAQWEDDSNLKI